MMLAPAVREDVWTEGVTRLNLLGADLLAARYRLKLSATAQARAIGVSTSSLSGAVSLSGNPTRSTVRACWMWLALVAE